MSVCISSLAGAEGPLQLPDPLITLDGRAVDSIGIWERVRRPEILELFRDQVNGRAPVGRPENVTTRVIETNDKALNGGITRKQVRVYLTGEPGGPHLDILIYLPNDQPRPVKMFTGLNFMGNHTINTDEDVPVTAAFTPWGQGGRGRCSRRWSLEDIFQRGYGIATLHCADLDIDRPNDFKDGVHGAFDPPSARTERPGDAWGSIGAWAWGLSRAMDYFETDDDIDHTHVAVVGHSRLGKAALWAGAQDERFSIVISNNSGCTGAALSRRRAGETITDINTKFPHWFCENYKQYNDNEDGLPVDQHLLLALIAPRPVYVASAVEDRWADPEGEFLSGVHAAPVYSLYGLAGLDTEVMPEPGHPINHGHIGYHIRTGKHGLTATDWKRFMDFADQHWKKDASSP